MPLPPFDALDPSTSVSLLRTQFDERLLGVPCRAVRLRWAVVSNDPDARQRGFQVRTRSGSVAEWTASEPEESAVAVDVTPGQPDLAPREVREYAVRIATDAGWTLWSPPVRIEAGIVDNDVQATEHSRSLMDEAPDLWLSGEIR